MPNSYDWNLENQEGPNKENVRKSRIVISAIFGLIGIVIILSQIFPLFGSFLEGKVYEFRASILANPIPDTHKEYIQGTFAYYNPGQSYFQNLLTSAGETTQTGGLSYDPISKKLREVKIDKEYQGELLLTINDLGIKNINISPNVESYDENVYNKFLKYGLAHFEGTPIPGDGGNSFIYGHSAVPTFFKNNTNLPEVVFSKLENIDIGNEIVVMKDGNELKYMVRNKKITEPDDFSILQSNGDKETVTLMTCWPLGVPSKRLIVVAERYE